MNNPVERALIRVRDPVVLFFCRRGVSPNLLTVTGLIFSSAAAFGFSLDNLRLAGILLLVAGAFDMLDGQVAREKGQATRFGAFFDSVVDRYSDTVIFAGIMLNYLGKGRDAYALLTIVALGGALITSYSRARGESLLSRCEVGYLMRPERVVLLIIGALSGKLDIIIWVLAILSHLTVLQRISFVWREIALEGANPNTIERERLNTGQGTSKPSENAGDKSSSFNLLYWNYPRYSRQFYLLSCIILVVVFLPDLWKLFR